MAHKYLLDTNIVSESMKATPHQGVLDRLEAAGRDVAIPSLVWHEIQYGLARMPQGARRRALESLAAAMRGAATIYDYDIDCAEWHARERARLERAGHTPPFVDGQIAAIAAVNRCTLVTRNVRDFAPFAGIAVESWFE